MANTQIKKKRLHKLMGGVLIIVGIIIVGLIYFISTFDIEAHRPMIESIISHSLDRDVRINGRIEPAYSLRPRLVVEDIRIGNLSRASAPDFAGVKRVEIQAALLPMFRKKLKILRLKLIGVDVNLERDQEGTPNWIIKRFSDNPNPEMTLDVRDIRIEDALITMHMKDLSLFTLSVDTLEGSLVYKPDHSPRLDILLKDTVIDLEKFIKQVDKEKNDSPKAASTGKKQRIIPDFSINCDPIRSLSTRIQVDNLKVMYETKHITTISITAAITNGVLSVLPFEGRSPTGSSSKAQLTLDASVSPPRTAFSWNTKGLDYGLILKDLNIRNDVVGKLDLKFDVKGQGSNLREFLCNATGDLEIVMAKGRTPKRLVELWGGGLLRFLIPTSWFEEDVTDLNCAVARFKMNDGIIQSNVLLSDTQRITVAGETAIDLKTEQVSGLFKPKTKQAALFRIGTPIKITGTLGNPRAESAESGLVSLGKIVLGLSCPNTLILMFGDLGLTEKNPCAALLQQPLPDSQ